MPGYCKVMFQHAFNIGYVICFIMTGVHMVSADAHLQKCIRTPLQNKEDIAKKFCFMSRKSVQLFCPPERRIVLKSFDLAVKNIPVCQQRVLPDDQLFCCEAQDIDVLYNTQCLQNIWNTEDKEHYKTFVMNALDTCMGKSKCTLNQEIFENLQRKIPSKEQYSSYLQVKYQCVKVPERPVSFCSSKSRIGKEINFSGTITEPATSNITCTCSVTSPHGGNISVKAVDVRPTQNYSNISKDFTLNIKQSNDKNITVEDLPLFGFKEIFSDKGINISLKLSSKSASENLKLWLHVSGSDGKDVNVSCSEGAGEVRGVTTVTGHVSRATQETALGFWPLLFGAIGAIVACCFLVLMFGVVWICRTRYKKKRQRPSSSLPSTQTFLHDPNYDPPYATVLDQAPDDRNMRVARSVSSQTLQRSYSKPYPKPYPRSTSMRSLRDRPPTAPPPPPPNHPTMGHDIYNQPYSRHPRLQGVSCDVQQLEAFLEGREPSSPVEPDSVHTLFGGPEYASPLLMGRSRLQSEQSVPSYFRAGHCFDPAPRSEADSNRCFGYVFEGEGSVTDSLLGRRDTLPIRPPKDLLGDAEFGQSLLLDHKEDENHNEFERMRPVMTRM